MMMMLLLLFLYMASRVRSIFPLWVMGFRPLEGPDRGSFFYCGVVGLQPLEDTCSNIFAQLLDTKCVYVPGSLCMTYLDHKYRSTHTFAGNKMFTLGKN